MKKLLTTVVISVGVVLLLVGCIKKKELSACDEKRKEIEEMYGITICYGDDKVDDTEISKIDLCKDNSKLESILKDVELYFSKLPEGFIEELVSMNKDGKTSLHVVIANSKYSGVSLADKNNEYWVICDENVIMTMAENMMYSIIYRIRYSDTIMEFMPEWKAYNPEGFEYGDVNEKYLYGNNNNEDCYFLIEESMESVINEMKVLFSVLWDERNMELYKAHELPKIDAKLQYLCSELDRVFETVDENAYWARYIK